MISVIICTHNPRRDYLERVLEALKVQTLSSGQWELLLIDNASTEPLAERWDLSWHPSARIVPEEELGLTPARLRGIAEAKGNLLVFVDDDNVLDADYLEQTEAIGKTHSWLGAWGGQSRPEFEVPPAPEYTQYTGCLALRAFEQDQWANYPHDHIPFGAGLCVRKLVAHRYAASVLKNPQKRFLDRKGNSLMGAGDTDLVLTCYEIGLGSGAFARLKLTHLIPKYRTSADYLFKLAVHAQASIQLMTWLRQSSSRPQSSSKPLQVRWRRKIWFKMMAKVDYALSSRERRISMKIGSEAARLGEQLIREAKVLPS